jgi:hypothetical protein
MSQPTEWPAVGSEVVVTRVDGVDLRGFVRGYSDDSIQISKSLVPCDAVAAWSFV